MSTDRTTVFYQISKLTIRYFFRLFWRTKIIGQENVPGQGAVIFAPNHRSYADPPLVGSSTYRTVHFLAKKELFHFKPFGFLITKLNAHRLNRAGPREGLRAMQALLKEGNTVLVFPEGRRMKTNDLGEAKPGIAMLASKTSSPIIPTYIHNSDDVWKFRKITVVFGKPLRPDGYKSYQELANRVLGEIAKLKSTFEK